MRLPALLVLSALFAAPPALAEGTSLPQHPAAVLDPAPFTHAVPVRARPSPEGVTRLRLSAAVLSAAQDNLADLRVVDAAFQQWPFVLVPDAGREALPLRIEGPRVEGDHSLVHFALPTVRAAVDGVSLEIARETFDRGFKLLGVPAAAGLAPTLGSGRLSRRPGGTQPHGARSEKDVQIIFGRTRVTGLDLDVKNGDEAPLPITSAWATAVIAELRLVAPAGEYTLLVGDPDARAPQYEIAGPTLKPEVMEAEAGEGEVGAPAPNPRHRPQLPKGEARDQLALWVVMGVAVAALGGLTLRLARREKPRGAGEGKGDASAGSP